MLCVGFYLDLDLDLELELGDNSSDFFRLSFYIAIYIYSIINTQCIKPHH